jgi:Uma2 family endonuclease
MAEPAIARPAATLADLEALPPGVKGEIIEGTLYTQPRLRARHQGAISTVEHAIVGPYRFGAGGPGGWWILPEPGVEVPGSPEFSPDIAGWRRERLADLPEEAIRVVPDWVCEILSPGTKAYDQRIKKPFYARIGVAHLWYVDLQARLLTVSRRHEAGWLELGVYGDDDVVRAEPFGEVELRLGDWWV